MAATPTTSHARTTDTADARHQAAAPRTRDGAGATIATPTPPCTSPPTTTPTSHRTPTASTLARQRLLDTEGGPFLISDWVETVFLHYAVEPSVLQPLVPFELEHHQGRAYVSLVAFTIRRLRPCFGPFRGGRVVEWLSAPVSDHGFLNVRTYVRHQDESGIFFLAEWLESRLSVFIGPRTFGLPYRYGRLSYAHAPDNETLRGEVVGSGAQEPGRTADPGHPATPRSLDDSPPALRYEATRRRGLPPTPAALDSLDAFLVERYTAFTERRGVRRRFRIWHEPWPLTPIDKADVHIRDDRLVATTGPWFEHAELVGAHHSPGVKDVWIGRPVCIQGPACERAWSRSGFHRSDDLSP